MNPVPEMVIYVRHSATCKFSADERSRRCDCRKFLRWTAGGMQHKLAAKTRSWLQAEKLKRDLEDQFSGTVNASSLRSERPPLPELAGPSHPTGLIRILGLQAVAEQPYRPS
jgi:hypothetical protein